MDKQDNKALNEDGIYEIAYSAARRSNGELWKGLSKFIYQNEEDNRKIIEALDEIKLLLKSEQKNHVETTMSEAFKKVKGNNKDG